MLGEDLVFDFMWRDELCAHVELHGDKVTYIKYTDNPVHLVFNEQSKLNKNLVYWFLESRCFSRHNGQCKTILRVLGLDYYDPLAICKLKHGVSVEDFNWIRFKGEEHLKWKDVMTTYHKEHETIN